MHRLDKALLDDIRATRTGGRILDLPAGDGNLSKALHEHGFDLQSADLFPEVNQWEEGRQAGKVVKADMNVRLPFDDNSFDGLVCQEGVEHLENLAGFFRECQRVIKDNGYLWITTPNFMDLSGRFSYLLTGMKSFHGGFPNEQTTVWGSNGDDLYHGHAFTLPLFQMRYLLRLAQFDKVHVQGIRRSGTAMLLYPFVRPLAGLLIDRAHRKHNKSSRRRAAAPELQSELRNMAVSKDLLLCKTILVRAQLRMGSFEPPKDGAK